MATHILGFPRIGAQRELKKSLESFWKGESDRDSLLQVSKKLRLQNWRLQQEAGLDFITVGDFSLYDQVLDTSVMLDVVPPRFRDHHSDDELDIYFRMARGRGVRHQENDHCAHDTFACEMTKWFDTNYHYIVPEFQAAQTFKFANTKLINEIQEAIAAGIAPSQIKPVLLGPITYLWLGKEKSAGLNRLDLLEKLLPVYAEILQQLQKLGVEWVQIDEPALVMDLPIDWRQAYEQAYHRLSFHSLKILLTTYFGGIEDNLSSIANLPVAGFHIDAVRAPEQVLTILDRLPNYKILSIGIVDGRNIWRNDFQKSLAMLEPLYDRLKDNLWVSVSCSLLHTPVDLDSEQLLDAELRSWLAFAKQKLNEVLVLNKALVYGRQSVETELHINQSVQRARRSSTRIHNRAVKERIVKIDDSMLKRKTAYGKRAQAQRKKLALPLFPTTTIGSFPQTTEIRVARREMKTGKLSKENYTALMQAEIKKAVIEQEHLGLDVLVHGEAERNDMVEYFGELLEGFVFTQNAWVQSYGSRCVKPPVIFGDVIRPKAMTVEWAQYAQALTEKPVKGMLTGPVTILQWSFVRDDQPRNITCQQIALALRDEVCDLERAGIAVIQIDEPAIREGLPLRKSQWQSYLDWAVECFRLTAAVVDDATQIHTHMCYSEFNDIIKAIAEMDADVITIETSRSDMELLEAFTDFAYPNEIGPGVYDIHSPRVASKNEMIKLILKAAQHIPAQRLWVNPDCGLKTRDWPEVRAALKNMVAAAVDLREQYENKTTIAKKILSVPS